MRLISTQLIINSSCYPQDQLLKGGLLKVYLVVSLTEGTFDTVRSIIQIIPLSSISRHLFPPPSPIFAGGANDRWVRSVSFCPDGRHIASITDDR